MNDYLIHYGVNGMKWGIRRYQNEDGSYKPGAEGRYAPDTNARSHRASRGMQDVEDGRKKSSSAVQAKPVQKPAQVTGGGSAAPSDITSAIEKITGKTITVQDVSKKKAQTQKGSGKGSGSSSKKSDEEKKKDKTGKKSDFDLSSLTDIIDNLFAADKMTDDDWENLELSSSDINKIDDLVTKYRDWKSTNGTSNKKTKKIDSFLERYNAWRSNHGVKHYAMGNRYLIYRDDELYHFGIPGMKWGVRRFQNEDGTLTEAGKKRYREASKDAKEFARAKMYYGEGAGTRRKLIKAKVEEKSKDAAYKEAFDYALSQQDMNKHADAAKRERKVEDFKQGVPRVARRTIAAVGTLVSAAAVLHYYELDRPIIDAGKKAAQAVMREIQYLKWRSAI